MSDFKRSPSKVWWASDSFEYREVSGSPGSQDSGYSDTDTPPLPPKQCKPENLSTNCVEKHSPEKTRPPGTPRRALYAKHSPRVSRSLFGKSRQTSTLHEEVVGGEVEQGLESGEESELVGLFEGDLGAPGFTSTPKGKEGRWRRNSMLGRQRFPITEDPPVKKWLTVVKQNCEQECMTTLQAKSIAADLHQKVTQIATFTTTRINNILSHAMCLKEEYKKLNSERRHIGPLAQSLAGNILSFLDIYTEVTPRLRTKYEAIRKCENQELFTILSSFFTEWELSFQTVLEVEVKRLTERLERPSSELDLRATITGITSLCLRNENLTDLFTKSDIIPILLILCEKCEGSSMRTLLLRALSTTCTSSLAIRQFEKYQGITTIVDTLSESSRPEPERAEAVALLAQITAPWIEDNHSIKSLQEHNQSLIKSLTLLTSSTKCCQNLLLCLAALVNLTSMDPKCVKYLLRLKTPEAVLEALHQRGVYTSVFLLEQVANLLANMTSSEAARKQLVALDVIPTLLCFLKTSHSNIEVLKRLQQKAVIALSRLCTLEDAARRVVEVGGVEKLVRLCREKEERFGNDAVLVATLATLRKIVDICGKDVARDEDVQELVEPKLLDSFLAYSAQNESYV